MPDFRTWAREIEIVQLLKVEDEQQPSDLNLTVPDTYLEKKNLKTDACALAIPFLLTPSQKECNYGLCAT